MAHPEGGTTECLLYPADPSNKILGLIYPKDVRWESHIVEVEGALQEARMFVVVKDQRGCTYSVDPFDFRWNSGAYHLFSFGKCVYVFPAHRIFYIVLSSRDVDESGFHWEARLGRDVWTKVSFHSHEWKLKTNLAITVNGDAVVDCLKCSSSFQIDCPSIIFVILPDKDKELYSLVKLVTNFYCGIQSQCLVLETYDRQRNVDQ